MSETENTDTAETTKTPKAPRAKKPAAKAKAKRAAKPKAKASAKRKPASRAAARSKAKPARKASGVHTSGKEKNRFAINLWVTAAQKSALKKAAKSKETSIIGLIRKALHLPE